MPNIFEASNPCTRTQTALTDDVWDHRLMHYPEDAEDPELIERAVRYPSRAFRVKTSGNRSEDIVYKYCRVDTLAPQTSPLIVVIEHVVPNHDGEAEYRVQRWYRTWQLDHRDAEEMDCASAEGF